MPSLSGKFDISIGPLINVVVAPAGVINPAVPPPPNIKVTAFPALIDTGASATCISPSVAQTVGLQPIGKQPMISATGSVPTNVYLVDLLLPFGNAGLILNSTQVMEFNPAGGSPFQMLVGRDIICQGIFTLSFDGHFSFAI
jgi:hypothetical protein